MKFDTRPIQDTHSGLQCHFNNLYLETLYLSPVFSFVQNAKKVMERWTKAIIDF